MQLNVTEWGDPAGAPVLCLHGVTGHGRRFRQLAEERLGAFRVVGIDYRGHGRSSWEPPWTVEQHLADLVDTSDALGVAGAAWVGHSFGGKLVAELALRHPDLVERAVLLDPAMHLDPAVVRERADLARPDLSFASPDDAIDTRLGDGSLFTTPRSTLEEEAREHLVEIRRGTFRWNYCQSAVVFAYGELCLHAPPPETLGAPTLLVHAEQFGLVRGDQLRAYRDRVEPVAVPGGHMVIWDAYEETADAVTSFLWRRQ